MTDTKPLTERLEIKAMMIQMGERIAYGSDSGIMHEAVAAIKNLQAERDALQAENERLKERTQILLDDCNTWAQELKNERRLSFRAERDALQAKLDAMGKGEPVAIRYKLQGDMNWQYTENRDQPTPPCVIQELFAAPKALAPFAIPADVLEAAVNMQTNHYRGPLAWAVKVIDFVADHGIGGTP